MTKKQILIQDELEDRLFAVLHDGKLWDKDGNPFGIQLWNSHNLYESKQSAENQLQWLRKHSGCFNENDGKVIVIKINFVGLAA